MGALWRVAVQTTPEAEEPVSELLSKAFGGPVSSYTDLRNSITRVEIFLPSRPANLPEAAESIRVGLTQLRAEGVPVGVGQLTVRRLPRRNWAESWKQHFHPLEIGRKLLLKPSWSRRKARKGCVTIVLDPGLSFGTGHHPTTAFCLQQLVKFRSDAPQSVLDVGTGSGVLAIAAARLGYCPVTGFDLDDEAIRNARANARRNRLSRRIEFQQRDLAAAGMSPARQRYAVVCANLAANLLIEHQDRLLGWIQPGGLLVLAGILKEEFGKVQGHYERAGLRLVTSRTKGGWRSGSFQLGKPGRLSK